MDRITQLTTAHPWLSDHAAHLLLVAYYKRFTDNGARGNMLQFLMDDITDSFSRQSRDEIVESMQMIMDSYNQQNRS